jgi:hypothetical protein
MKLFDAYDYNGDGVLSKVLEQRQSPGLWTTYVVFEFLETCKVRTGW